MFTKRLKKPVTKIRNKIAEVRTKRAEKREKYAQGNLENQSGKRWYHDLICFNMYVSDDDSLREDKEPQRTISERYNIGELFNAGDKGDKPVGETKMVDGEFMIISLQKAEPAVVPEALNVNEVMSNV